MSQRHAQMFSICCLAWSVVASAANVHVRDFGAFPDGRDNRAAIQNAITAAGDGTVRFDAGEYRVNGELVIIGNPNLIGASTPLVRKQPVKESWQIEGPAEPVGLLSRPDTKIASIVQGGGGEKVRGKFAYHFNASARRFNAEGIVFDSNNGLFRNLDGALDQFRLRNCRLTWGRDGAYFNRIAVVSTVACKDPDIQHCEFKDSPTADRTFETYGWGNLKFLYNVNLDVRDGLHLLDGGSNNRINWNVWRLTYRMPLEIQGNSKPSDWQINGNVVWDFKNPYNDSGVSVPHNRVANSLAQDNYLKFSIGAGTWSTPSSPEHFGRPFYALEWGGIDSLVNNNVFVGKWTQLVVTTMTNSRVKDNKYFGPGTVWQPMYAGEPGDGQFGSIKDLGGNTSAPENQAYPIPAYALDALNMQPPATQPIPNPGVTVTNLKTTAAYKTVDLKWDESGAGTVTIARHTKNGAADANFTPPSPPLPAGVKAFTDTQFTQHMLDHRWEFFYKVNGVQSSLVQVGNNPPATQPIPDPDFVFNGVIIELKLDKYGAVKSAATKPVTP